MRFVEKCLMTSLQLPVKLQDGRKVSVLNQNTPSICCLVLGASQAGMSGFGAFRNNTIFLLQNQDQRSQGMIPYQMGVNFLDSQAGKTAFGKQFFNLA